MIYAICPQKDGIKWVILKGWNSCIAGQGNILAENVDFNDLENELKRYRDMEKKTTT